MTLRAKTTRAADWVEQRLWVYEGTYLELHPEYGSGCWMVVDSRDPEARLSGPWSRVNDAKRSAERLAEASEYRKGVT